MTLDEAIAKAYSTAEKYTHGSAVLKKHNMPVTAEKYRVNAEEQRTIADWLSELRELRGVCNGQE